MIQNVVNAELEIQLAWSGRKHTAIPGIELLNLSNLPWPKMPLLKPGD